MDVFVVKVDMNRAGTDFLLYGPFPTYEKADRFAIGQLDNMAPGPSVEVFKLCNPQKETI